MNTSNLKNTISIANPNDRENFNRYLLEISKFKPLSREEEIQTFKLVETGDQRAIDKISKHNLLFVVSVAKRYHVRIANTTLTLEDLINEGNMGLITAISRFDYRTGNKFISYAVWWIKQNILNSINSNIKTIRIPTNIKTKYNKINKKEAVLSQQLGRHPSTLEIFESMLADGDIGEKEDDTTIDEIIRMNMFESSLNSFISEEDTTELQDMVKCDNDLQLDEMIAKERNLLLYQMLEVVPERVMRYINDYYGLDGKQPMTLKEIGEKYDMSGTSVDQNIKKHLRRIKHNNRLSHGYFFETPDHVYNRQKKKEKTFSWFSEINSLPL